MSTNRLAFKPSFCTFNSLIESSKCTSWRRFTFCAAIGGYVNISGRSMWIIRWRRDKVHNKCLILLYVSKQKSKAQWTSVALGRRRGASPAGTHSLCRPDDLADTHVTYNAFAAAPLPFFKKDCSKLLDQFECLSTNKKHENDWRSGRLLYGWSLLRGKKYNEIASSCWQFLWWNGVRLLVRGLVKF